MSSRLRGRAQILSHKYQSAFDAGALGDNLEYLEFCERECTSRVGRLKRAVATRKPEPEATRKPEPEVRSSMAAWPATEIRKRHRSTVRTADALLAEAERSLSEARKRLAVERVKHGEADHTTG